MSRSLTEMRLGRDRLLVQNAGDQHLIRQGNVEHYMLPMFKPA